MFRGIGVSFVIPEASKGGMKTGMIKDPLNEDTCLGLDTLNPP